jgi:hypothetical protein
VHGQELPFTQIERSSPFRYSVVAITLRYIFRYLLTLQHRGESYWLLVFAVGFEEPLSLFIVIAQISLESLSFLGVIGKRT